MVGKGLGEGGLQKVGVYEDGWQGLGKVVCKRVGFMRMVGKGVGERWLAKGGVYEDGWQRGVGERWLAKGGNL
jgi:hypothetical protein